jgi:hypothetical protein
MEFFNRKDVWTFVIKYLEINDILNLELSSKTIQSGILNYYQQQTESFPKDSKKFNSKKEYLKKYMNACIVCNIQSEYDSDTQGKNHSDSDKFFSPDKENLTRLKEINLLNEDSMSYKLKHKHKLPEKAEVTKRLFSQEYIFLIFILFIIK